MVALCVCADPDARHEGHNERADGRVPAQLPALRPQPQPAPRAEGVPRVPHLTRLQHPRGRAGREGLPRHHELRSAPLTLSPYPEYRVLYTQNVSYK